MVRNSRRLEGIGVVLLGGVEVTIRQILQATFGSFGAGCVAGFVVGGCSADTHPALTMVKEREKERKYIYYNHPVE